MQATNDEQGIRGGSKPETAKAVGSSWSTKAHTKHEKKERRRQLVEAKLGAAAAEDMVTAAATAVEAETDETTKLKDRRDCSGRHKKRQRWSWMCLVLWIIRSQQRAHTL